MYEEYLKLDKDIHKFDCCSEWIIENIEHGIPCEQIKTRSEDWLSDKVEKDFWPAEVREEGVWCKLVDLAKSDFDEEE